MRRDFVVGLLEDLLAAGALSRSHSVVATCSGEVDREVLEHVGLRDITLTNVDTESGTALHDAGGPAHGEWVQADAHALPFPDGAFDLAFVSDGLHHCRSPHLAVTEMLRVARVGVVVVESRDSAAMSLAQRLGMTQDYEFNDRLLTTRTHGGVDFGPVPNFVYRWTEREFQKLLKTYEPHHDFDFRFYYGLALPPPLRRRRAARAAAAVATTLSPRQGNTFGMVALRAGTRPYLTTGEGGPVLREDVVAPVATRPRRDAVVSRRLR